MVNGKHHKADEKTPIFSIFLSLKFWNFKNNEPTTPIPRGKHRVPQEDHVEASAEDRRWGMGDARVRSSTGSGGNAVVDDLYRETAGNRGTVG